MVITNEINGYDNRYKEGWMDIRGTGNDRPRIKSPSSSYWRYKDSTTVDNWWLDWFLKIDKMNGEIIDIFVVLFFLPWLL